MGVFMTIIIPPSPSPHTSLSTGEGGGAAAGAGAGPDEARGGGAGAAGPSVRASCVFFGGVCVWWRGVFMYLCV